MRTPEFIHRELQKPIKCTANEVELAVYQANNQRYTIENICPYRHYPLDKGRIVNGNLQCAYHGWTFNGEGGLIDIPNSLEKKSKCKMITAYKTHAYNGILFVSKEYKPFSQPYIAPVLNGEPFEIKKDFIEFTI